MADANSAQAHHWNFDAGPGWVARQEQLDRMLEPLGERGLATASPVPGERAIDVGCGCGATTIALARLVGGSGHVLGVDISEPMLARARERCAELRLANVELMRSDAQQAQLPPAHDARVLSLRGHVLRRPDSRHGEHRTWPRARWSTRLRLLARPKPEPVDGHPDGRRAAARAGTSRA